MWYFQLGDNLLVTIDHVLSTPAEILQKSQEKYNSSSLYVLYNKTCYPLFGDFHTRILEGLREVIDNYPLPPNPPLELQQESFTAIVDFDFDLETFMGTFATFTITTGNSSGLGPDNIAATDAIGVTSSVSLSSDLGLILKSQNDTRIVFVMYTTINGVFTERQEYVVDNNRTDLALGSMVVIEARLPGSAVVANIENVVTLVFPKNDVVSKTRSII